MSEIKYCLRLNRQIEKETDWGTVDYDREAGRDKEKKKEKKLWCTVFVENGRKSSEGDREGHRRCFGVREKEESKNSRRC